MRKYTLIAVVGAALEMAHAASVAQSQGFFGGGGGNRGGAGAGSQRQPSTRAIAKARDRWQADTNTVSDFLSTAESMDPDTMQQQARRALAAEKDELTHKAVLDLQFNNGGADADAAVRQADQVLANEGTFQLVVDGLQRMASRGASMTPRQVSHEVSDMNRNRCPFVLPSIDAYLDAASGVVQDGQDVRAVRPFNCSGDTAQGGNGGSSSNNSNGNNESSSSNGNSNSNNGNSNSNNSNTTTNTDIDSNTNTNTDSIN